MMPISAATSPVAPTSADVRRRSEAESASTTRDPPPVANDQRSTGRPILPVAAAFDVGGLDAGRPGAASSAPEEPEAVAAAPRVRPEGRGDGPAAEDLGDEADAASNVRAESPAEQAPTSRLEVVNVEGRLGAPIAAYDNSKNPPTLVLYV